MVTAAVYNVATGATFTYHNGYHERTASIVKIDILADLLYESQHSGKPLTAKQQSLATSMIEASTTPPRRSYGRRLAAATPSTPSMR